MAIPTATQGHKPIIEYRRYARRHFIVFPDLGVELAMAPRHFDVARYLAYHSWLGTPFHTRIPCYPRNTPYPRPNIVYPKEVDLRIPLMVVEGELAIEVAIPQQKEEAVMATTITVKARAWGALVSITKKSEGEVGHDVETREYEVPANTTQDFVIVEGEKIGVEMGAAPPAGGQDSDDIDTDEDGDNDHQDDED